MLSSQDNFYTDYKELTMVIPPEYICPITRRLMVEPVVIVNCWKADSKDRPNIQLAVHELEEEQKRLPFFHN